MADLSGHATQKPADTGRSHASIRVFLCPSLVSNDLSRLYLSTVATGHATKKEANTSTVVPSVHHLSIPRPLSSVLEPWILFSVADTDRDLQLEWTCAQPEGAF